MNVTLVANHTTETGKTVEYWNRDGALTIVIGQNVARGGWAHKRTIRYTCAVAAAAAYTRYTK